MNQTYELPLWAILLLLIPVILDIVCFGIFGIIKFIQWKKRKKYYGH